MMGSVCVSRLDANCSLAPGCGGVGLLWRRSVNITPLSNVKSDRFCAAKLIILVKLPWWLYIYPALVTPTTTYFNDVQSVISYCEDRGPTIICGDFSVDFRARQPQNSRSRLLNDLVSHPYLYVVSQSSLSSGSDYTFFY